MRKALSHIVNLYKRDALTICNAHGEDIMLEAVTSTTKDEYGVIIGRSGEWYTLRAYPVIENPTQKQIEAGGLRDAHDCMIYIPVMALENNNISKDMLLGHVVIFRELRYRISEIKEDNRLCGEPIYYVLGLSRQ